MEIKINGVAIAAYPSSFVPTVLDLDDGESTTRTADGTLNRDRIAVKRQIDMEWGVLTWAEISALMQAMSGVFFSVTYPDPMAGAYQTKTFYVGNRQAAFAVAKGNDIRWQGLKVTLTER
ncbi:hypothetical protein SAMN04487969_101133 [Paenibacillus algorifonticola]|uniref:Phage tail tube protein n=1 Tax=Paenibacillus algorifonticola TaxID=684063 RepID=A0A1I1XWI6_9BACL|nr:DUF6711 family protein [Paenibacillus algorifonticola]SFE11539.1 hypothetical protein SAMN04487969_101133 [Paenibacillus algorifonticola]